LEFPGFEKPDTPFHDKRVRQAVSLALDRQALSDAEVAGLGPPYGNWMAEHVSGALKVPVPKQDVEKAKQLLAEAGYPNGLDGEQINAIVNTFDSLAERVLTQLRPIGIQLRLNAMDQVAYNAALLKNQAPDRLRGIAVSSVTGGPGNAASRIESLALCKGSRSPKCLPEVDAKFARYQASVDPNERDRLITEIQQYLLDEQIFVPLIQSVFFGVQGPRIANESKEIWGAIPFYASGVGPFEDIRIKE
jgi:ABC-type transport system substrate-binding protein